ncbi:hypothetical protein F4680DRAFT_469209 [Xylaria scruposa]|nr:hypothetical protein F4680DRAFT_469209 [Xylaria scruposa]
MDPRGMDPRGVLPVLPHTLLITYLGADLDKKWFRRRRMLSTGAEMVPSAIRLTRSNIYGVEFIYDTATKLVTKLTNDPAAGWPKVTGMTPRDSLAPLIRDYRELRYLATPSHVDFSPAIYANSGGTPPHWMDELDRRVWQNKYNVWKATQKLRDMYLEHGWDIRARNQVNFRRGDFSDERDDYMKDVILPLLFQVEPSERLGWCFLTEEDEEQEAERRRRSTQ